MRAVSARRRRGCAGHHSYTALLGANDQPGELAGYGPIPSAVARDLAAGGTWRRILTDPASGRPLDYGTTHYRPPEHLAGS